MAPGNPRSADQPLAVEECDARSGAGLPGPSSKADRSGRRRLRTTNNLKRLDKEIKRRALVATLVPTEESPLRLASAVLSEISDAWKTDRAYLTWKPDDPPLKNCALQKRCCFVAA